jgi:hypothetical protein
VAARVAVMTTVLRYNSSRSQGSVIVTVTRLRTGRPRNLGSIPLRGKL